MKLLYKKQICLILVTALLAIQSVIPVSAEGRQATVIAKKAIVRETGEFSGAVLGTLVAGTKVTVQGMQNDWYYIIAEDEKVAGWMYKDLIILDGEESEKHKKGQVTVDLLNVRSSPSLNAKIMMRVPEKTEFIIIGSQGKWYHIALNQVQNGWVHSDYLKVIPNYPKGKVSNSDVTLKATCEKIGIDLLKLQEGNIIYIKGYSNEWYNVVTEDFIEGWIEAENIELQIDTTAYISRSGSRASMVQTIGTIVEKYLGKKYVWGHTGPNTFDCSGFVYYIFNTYYGAYLKERGIDVPRTSREQANIGTPVSREELMVGDLVFFNTDTVMKKRVTHVGIYLGDGVFVHASSSGRKVVKSRLDGGYYYRRFLKAVRL